MKKQPVNSVSFKEIDTILQLFYDYMGEIYTCFEKHRLSLKYQQASSDLNRQLRKSLASLYKGAAKMPAKEVLLVQAIALNFSKIYYNLLRLSTQVEAKIKDKVLFSDEAVKEMTEFLRRTRELLPHVRDALKTGNNLIISHVVKEADELMSWAAKTTARHEERLTKGICPPKASVIYIQMLLHLEDILWHCKALVSEENGVPVVT